MNEALLFAMGGAGLASFIWMAHWVSMLKAQITERDAKIERLREAQRKHLPYSTAEDLEHAMAALIMLQSKSQYENTLLDNAMEWMRKAREGKQVAP